MPMYFVKRYSLLFMKLLLSFTNYHTHDNIEKYYIDYCMFSVDQESRQKLFDLFSGFVLKGLYRDMVHLRLKAVFQKLYFCLKNSFFFAWRFHECPPLHNKLNSIVRLNCRHKDSFKELPTPNLALSRIVSLLIKMKSVNLNS